MLAVAGIDPLGAVAEAEVAAALELADPLDLRPANLLGHSGIDRAFIDDRRAPLGSISPAIMRVAASDGADRSGRLLESTGVGTVTM